MVESSPEKGAATGLNEVLETGADRFVRALDAHDPITVPIEAPDPEPAPLSEPTAAAEGTPEPTSQETPLEEKRPMGSIWVNKENEPERPEDNKSWVLRPALLDRKTWWESWQDMKETMRYKSGRTWGEFFDQTLDTALNQVHPTLKEYKLPEPDVKVPLVGKVEIPGWWKAARGIVGKLVEGLHRNIWWMSPLIGGTLVGSLTAPLPGPNVLAVVLAPIGAVLGLLVRTTGIRIQHLDYIMTGIHACVVWPASKVIGFLGWLTGITALIKADPVGKAIDYVGEKTGLYQFVREDRVGKKIDEWRGGNKQERAEKKQARDDAKVKEREESGDQFAGAFNCANEELEEMLRPIHHAITLDFIDVCSPQSYKKDLLENFDLPTSRVDLVGLATHISAGETFQRFKRVLKSKKYECRIVYTEKTVVIEMWKTGQHPSEIPDESYIPEPRARPYPTAA